MLVNKILKVVLLLLGVAFIVLQSLAYEVEGVVISSLTLLLLAILYFRYTENISNIFFWFLAVFTTAEMCKYLSYVGPSIPKDGIDYYYYITNILYIISYILLIVRIIKGLDLKKVFSELSIPILILIVLDILCVSVVSATTENVLSVYQNYLEFTYNAIIMILLSVALIGYMYRNDNKSMLFLLASIFIVFSEIIQIAYYYVLEDDQNLGFIYSLFLVVAFIFLYLQSQLQFTGPEPEYMDESLEV
ncbi:hypothetical protein FBALC1_10172 [Flavobacteriales bacterium ALC-1]|nr:hypothetical protein FBALC1_10172 [Flavobacteriales bacterium ALC-1]